MTDISAIFRRHFSIFSDFSSKRFLVAKIVSIKADIRYIGNFNPCLYEMCFDKWFHAVVSPDPIDRRVRSKARQ